MLCCRWGCDNLNIVSETLHKTLLKNSLTHGLKNMFKSDETLHRKSFRPTLRCGGTKRPLPKCMAVLGPNKAYLCYYLVIYISRGLSVTIKTKNVYHIVKID